MIGWAIDALLASALLLALVLAMRGPVRRAFGPGVAYALWALPALRLLLPPMPFGWLHASGTAPTHAAGSGVAMLLLPPTIPDAATPVGGAVLVAIWAAGAAVVVAVHVAGYLRFVRRVVRAGRVVGREGGIVLIELAAVADPLAYGLWRPVVVVPTDFADRYDAAERQFALAHEVAHHQRGDVAANWAALATLAFNWCDPLAWVAFRAFRADQEMAADAHVLARCASDQRHPYARAIVKAACGRVPAAACGLHTINNVKGRLRMLARATSRGRHAAGLAVVGATTAILLGLTASGGQAADVARAGVEQAVGVPIAAWTPAALVRYGPATPPPPPGPTAPGSGGRHVATVREDGTVRVTVTENGRTRRYDGAAAEAWLAANPQPAPPAPHAPAALPTPPVAAGQARTIVVRPDAQGAPVLMVARTGGAPLPTSVALPRGFELPRDCGSGSATPPPASVIKGEGGDAAYTILCTLPAGSGDVAGAYRQALSSLATLRRSIATQLATAAFPESERRVALASVDASIAEVEADLAQAR